MIELEFALKTARNFIISLFPGIYRRYTLEKRYAYSHCCRLQKCRISAVRKRGSVNVVFVLSSFAMWRLEDVYRFLKEDSRFRVHLVLCPFRTFDEGQKKRSIEELRLYCIEKGWPFIDKTESPENVIATLNPDIIFYPQLYSHLFDNELDCEKNLDRLIAYVPYGLPTVTGEWMYNSRYMNTVWKLYFPTKLHLTHARAHSLNRARNMEIVGDPHAAAFFNGSHRYKWKEQDKEKKRVIWAPHFSIGDGGYLHRASFLWLHDIMWRIAVEYKDRIQFVFKPHPRLLSELYLHPDWGKDRADNYFEKWKNGDNTQLETGEYIDLFCSSDAMIHDCGSFTAEFHYTGKPVAFVSTDFPAIYEGLDEFGKKCLDLHYHVSSEQDIRDFMNQVVLGGVDGMSSDRLAFRNNYLIPPPGKSFPESVYKSLTKCLFGK